MSAIVQWMEGVQWFDPRISLEIVAAQLFWYFGGVFFAFGLGAFSSIVRASRDAPTL